MSILTRLSVGKRILLIGCVSLLGLVLVLFLSTGELNTALRKSFNERTRQTVDVAYSQLVRFEAEEKAGRMTREQAQAAAKATIQSLRFGDDNYFFLLDTDHKMLMHPVKPDLVGKSVYDKADGGGKFHYREMVSLVAASGEGFVAYQYKMPDGSGVKPKISYVKGFKPWGWIVVTGVFDSEIKAAVHEAVLMLGTVVAVVVAILAGVILVISGSITRPIKQITGRMRSLASGDTGAEIPGTDRGDEIGGMAAALQVFRDNALARQAAEVAKAQADADQKAVVELLSDKLRALSQGDLTGIISAGVPASYATLSDHFNKALLNLRELIGALAEASHSIETGSREIAGASEDLARRTEVNAASLEQTSAALSQMNGRLRSSAQVADRTVESAQQAMSIVDIGRATAEQASSAMVRVADSAEGIDGVIAGLDKIAFQTRVLAMNAAVEAGRAGEAGRGFAVVADLVSALAMRAEEEAGRARQQLTATQADVVVAVEAVRNVDAALAQITGSVAQVHQFVETMATDNRSQVSTIGEIASAVNAMDQATQQNAAMVEETSAAARNLANEVGTLTSQSSRFDVGDKAAASKRQPSRAATAQSPRSEAPSPPRVAARQLETADVQNWTNF